MMKKTIIILAAMAAIVGCSKFGLDADDTKAPKEQTQKDTTYSKPIKKGFNVVHLQPAPVWA